MLKKLLINSIILIFTISAGYSQQSKSTKDKPVLKEDMGKAEFVDIRTAENQISRLKKEITELTQDNSEKNSENKKSNEVISQCRNLIEKINKLLVKVEAERKAFADYSKEVVDSQSSAITTKSYSENTETKLKLEKKNNELNNIIEMHQEKISVNNKKINKNNSIIAYNEKKIKVIESSIKLTKNRQNEIKTHVGVSSSLKNEADALIKSNITMHEASKPK
ncbi:MAG: hypothetical protein SVR08_04350 [Spirochaetota bacterium]|nr:hypothetical protein [Spirochaetota bacterium]